VGLFFGLFSASSLNVMRNDHQMLKIHNYIIIVLSLSMLNACSHDSSDKIIGGNPSGLVNITEPTFANPENLRFSYSIDSIHQFLDGNIFDLTCKLHNGNSDTLYFYTQTCFGWEHNFLIDTSKVRIHTMILCNVSNPVIKKIEPRGDFDFKGHFFVKDRKLKTIHVEYYIYQVDQNFNVRNSDSISNLKKTIIRNTHNSK
jgi:hypothetical protein